MTIYKKLHDAMMEHYMNYIHAPRRAFLGEADWQELAEYFESTARYSSVPMVPVFSGQTTFNMPLGGVVLYRAEGLKDVVVA